MEFDYKKIFEEIKTAAFMADAETGEILECNRAAEELLGRERGDIIGIHQSKLHPVEEAEKYRNMFREHVEKGEKIQFEAETLKKDGSRVPIVISVRVMKTGGKEIIIGVFTDITEQKKAERALKGSEEKLQGMLGSIGDHMSMMDKDLNILWANETAKKYM